MEEIKIELFIPGELKDEPIICDMIKNYNIDMKILEASFWAYLIVSGQKSELDKLLSSLSEKGINVETRE